MCVWEDEIVPLTSSLFCTAQCTISSVSYFLYKATISFWGIVGETGSDGALLEGVCMGSLPSKITTVATNPFRWTVVVGVLKVHRNCRRIHNWQGSSSWEILCFEMEPNVLKKTDDSSWKNLSDQTAHTAHFHISIFALEYYVTSFLWLNLPCLPLMK